MFSYVEKNNPGLNNEEIDERINELLENLYPYANENIDVKREFSVEGDKTEITLSVTPQVILDNASIFEFIPKCFSSYVNDIEFENNDFKIIKDDPLIMWHFNKLDEQKILKYKANKEISEKCKELFLAFGIAVPETKKESKNIFFGAAITLLVILAVVLFSHLKK